MECSDEQGELAKILNEIREVNRNRLHYDLIQNLMGLCVDDNLEGTEVENSLLS